MITALRWQQPRWHSGARGLLTALSFPLLFVLLLSSLVYNLHSWIQQFIAFLSKHCQDAIKKIKKFFTRNVRRWGGWENMWKWLLCLVKNTRSMLTRAFSYICHHSPGWSLHDLKRYQNSAAYYLPSLIRIHMCSYQQSDDTSFFLSLSARN